MKMRHRLDMRILLIFLLIAAGVSLVVCACIGPVPIRPGTIFRIVFHHIFVGTENAFDWTSAQDGIVWTVRIPRVLLGFFVGCTLSFAGASMQTLVRNELADPYILGVSYGAAAFSTIGVVLGLFSFLGVFAMPVNGCIGALISLVFVYLYSTNRGKISVTQLLLGGVAVSLFTRAIVKLLVSSNVQAFLHNNTAFWTSGGLAGTKWQYFQVVTPLILIGFTVIVVNYRVLNALLFGEDTALTLGIEVKSAQKLLIITLSVMIGLVVSVSGGIGFVGLVVPHVTRIFVGGNHRRVFPVAMLLGGIFVLWCDAAARTIFAPEEISVGILTAIIGGPLFIYLLRRGVSGKAVSRRHA